VRRCDEVGVAVPDSLIARIDDLTERVKDVRDEHVEHPTSPLTTRQIDLREGTAISAHRVVVAGDDPEAIQFESAASLRDAIHAYVREVVELLERAKRERS
jgi:hypothetical protein